MEHTLSLHHGLEDGLLLPFLGIRQCMHLATVVSLPRGHRKPPLGPQLLAEFFFQALTMCLQLVEQIVQHFQDTPSDQCSFDNRTIFQGTLVRFRRGYTVHRMDRLDLRVEAGKPNITVSDFKNIASRFLSGFVPSIDVWP